MPFQEQEFVPDMQKYVAMLKHHSGFLSMTAASKSRLGLEANVVSYNSLIFACGRQGDPVAAEKWVSRNLCNTVI